MGFPSVDHYRSRAQALGVSEFVTFTGRVPYPQAPLYLALGDVAVAPKISLSESSGKLLNYMAVGLPVVAFDTPVAREYLGPNGIFATTGDPGSLAERLLGLLSPAGAPEKRAALGERLRQRAAQQFSWEKGGYQIVDTYEQLVGEGAAQTVAARKWSTTRR
jgi:glycosyltransferase involved in cell wall biosynthesis